MRFLSSLFFTTVVSGACASPYPNAPGGGDHGKCLTKAAVDKITHDYAQVIGNYTDALADQFLAADFSDTSDSINALAGIPLGNVTFPNKAAFKAGQAQLPKIPLVVKAVDAVTCDTVVLRWTQTFGNPPKPAQGISILVNVRANDKKDDADWKLKTLYTEFNSLTYFTNTGGSCTAPPRG
ncbi:uncharacterized protein PG998_008996 [Apiospora kogelbergensis]|uniref:NTF2-like domain-containing protein n=1 Tax=Apiospora kogelbergensis TaxID=1337665 RepID=A0AAW0R6F2_9PEZI